MDSNLYRESVIWRLISACCADSSICVSCCCNYLGRDSGSAWAFGPSICPFFCLWNDCAIFLRYLACSVAYLLICFDGVCLATWNETFVFCLCPARETWSAFCLLTWIETWISYFVLWNGDACRPYPSVPSRAAADLFALTGIGICGRKSLLNYCLSKGISELS